MVYILNLTMNDIFSTVIVFEISIGIALSQFPYYLYGTPKNILNLFQPVTHVSKAVGIYV